MITAVDTNVLIDVLEGDLKFGQASAVALVRASREGALVACEVVWAEVATVYGPAQDVLEDLAGIGLRFDPMQEVAAVRAADAWAACRDAGGTRRRIAADFLIGAHAVSQADRLLTRDGGFHRKYFAKLRVESP